MILNVLAVILAAGFITMMLPLAEFRIFRKIENIMMLGGLTMSLGAMVGVIVLSFIQ
jgi:hypothetical protein